MGRQGETGAIGERWAYGDKKRTTYYEGLDISKSTRKASTCWREEGEHDGRKGEGMDYFRSLSHTRSSFPPAAAAGSLTSQTSL